MFDLFMDNKYYAVSEYIVEINRLLDPKGYLSIQIDYRPANLYCWEKHVGLWIEIEAFFYHFLCFFCV